MPLWPGAQALGWGQYSNIMNMYKIFENLFFNPILISENVNAWL